MPHRRCSLWLVSALIVPLAAGCDDTARHDPADDLPADAAAADSGSDVSPADAAAADSGRDGWIDGGGPDASGDPPAADAGTSSSDEDGGLDAGPTLDCGARTECAGRCVDLATDGAHCGACEAACDASEVCLEGACTAGPVEAWTVDFDFGGGESALVEDFAVDAEGNLYVVGTGRAAPYRTLPGSRAGGFVERWDTDGTLGFRQVMPHLEATGASPLGVAAGEAGRYYVIGSTVGAYPFDATHSSAPEDRGYVAAYDAHHAIEWLITTDLVASRQLERHGDQLYAVMRGQDFPIELEGVRFTTDDGIGFDWFTVALTTAGAVRWGHGSDTDDRANGLAVLADHVVRAGYHTIATGGGLSSHRYQLDALDHDGTTLDGYDDFGVPGGSAVAEGGGVVHVAASGPDGWVLQRYVDRTLDWERALGEAVHVSDVVVDARGRAYLGGTLSGAHSFDGEHLGEEHDGWVAAFDAEGGLRWVDIVDNPAGSLWVVMKEVEVSLASGLVYYRYRVTSRDGERVVALRQPE